MLVLGHVGLTLGAATLAAGVLKNRRGSSVGKVSMSWFAYLGQYLDIRLLLVGSLLPDIIDKPVGHVFFRETFSNGRIFSHTLLFFILLAAAGLIFYRHGRRVWLLTLASGIFLHLIMDEMWVAPGTLFWPFLGLAFEKEEMAGWLMNMWHALFSNPAVYIPEAVGLLILLWFGLSLLSRKKAIAFIKYGRVS